VIADRLQGRQPDVGEKALAAIGADVFVPDTPADLAGAAGIIVPASAFRCGLRAGSWIDAILARVGEGGAVRHLPRDAVV
jgi:hypothetical protein